MNLDKMTDKRVWPQYSSIVEQKYKWTEMDSVI